jgi:hypoxanthine phosphoribosyltransferase
LIDETAIARRIDEIARDIVKTIGIDLVAVGLLKGCFVFMADLTRALHRHGAACAVDFLQLSSYATAKVSSGSVKMASDVTMDLAGRRVLIVDDILDSGRTLAFARDRLQAHNPAGLWTAVLLDKPSRREVAFQADFVGFAIPDRFVAGYGIDHAESHRDLPHIIAID